MIINPISVQRRPNYHRIHSCVIIVWFLIISDRCLESNTLEDHGGGDGGDDLLGVQELKQTLCLDYPLEIKEQVLYRDLSKRIVIIHHRRIVEMQGWLDRKARLRLVDTSKALTNLIPESISDQFDLVSAFGFRTRLVLNLVTKESNIHHQPAESLQAVLDLSNQMNLINQTDCNLFRDQMHRVEQLICEPMLRSLLKSRDNIFTYQSGRYEYELLFRVKQDRARRAKILFRVQGYNVSLIEEDKMDSFYSPLGVITIGWIQPYTNSNALDLGYQTHYLKMESGHTRLLPIVDNEKDNKKVLANLVLTLPNQIMYGCPPPLCFTPTIDAAFYNPSNESSINDTSHHHPHHQLKLLPNHVYLFSGLYYYEINLDTLRVPNVSQAKLISSLFTTDMPVNQQIGQFSYVDAVLFHRLNQFLLFFKDDKVLRLYAENDQHEFKELSLNGIFKGYANTYVDYVFEQGPVINLVVNSNIDQFRLIDKSDQQEYMQVYEPFVIHDPMPAHVRVHLLLNHTRYIFTQHMVYKYNERFERIRASPQRIELGFFRGCRSQLAKHDWPQSDDSSTELQSLHFMSKRSSFQSRDSDKVETDTSTWLFFFLLLAVACASIFMLILLMKAGDGSDYGTEGRPTMMMMMGAQASEEQGTATLASQELAVSHASSEVTASNDRPPKWLQENQKSRKSIKYDVPEDVRQALVEVHSKQSEIADLNSKDDSEPSLSLIPAPAALHRTKKKERLAVIH